MLASPLKLAENNLNCILSVLDALRIVRENGGYGCIELTVKDGIVLRVRKIVDENIASTPNRA